MASLLRRLNGPPQVGPDTATVGMSRPCITFCCFMSLVAMQDSLGAVVRVQPAWTRSPRQALGGVSIPSGAPVRERPELWRGRSVAMMARSRNGWWDP